MLATNYHYTIDALPEGGFSIVLSSNDGMKQKKFYIAASTMEGLTRHMESLTDENCDGFFPAPRGKKSK